MALEIGPDFGDVHDVRDVDLGDVGAPAGTDLHQVLQRQPLDRLAQRGAPDPELGHQLILDEGRARRQFQGHDLVANLEVGPIGDQPPGRRVRRVRGVGLTAAALS